MNIRSSRRVMMISTHGYVAAHPVLGKPDTGGQVVFVLKLSECLARMGFKVDIFTRQFEDQPAVEALNEMVRVLRFPCGGKDFIPKETLCAHIPEWITNAGSFIKSRKLKYAAINSHYWDAGLAGEGLKYQLGIPHIHTPHSLGAWKRDNMDGDSAENEQKYNFRHRIATEQEIYRNCEFLIATTEEQSDYLQGENYSLPLDKLAVNPPGYDDMQFFPVSESTRQGIKEQFGLHGPVVMALGRMAHNKGYDLLIQAMQHVKQRVPEARLVLAIGSKEPSPREMEQLAELKQLASNLGIMENVIFHDYIPDDELADFYRAADVFALSSRYEPFGMTAVEAMACGTATVVTTEGGLWKNLTWGDDVLYANPFDPEMYGMMLTQLLKYPEVRLRVAEQGAKAARSQFTWSSVAQQTLQVIDQLHDSLASSNNIKTLNMKSDLKMNSDENHLATEGVS